MLIFVVQHTVTFSPNLGTDFLWELDLLRSYKTTSLDGTALTNTQIVADPNNSWITLDGNGDLVFPSVGTLQGSGEPFIVEFLRDYDTYKPIQSSRATLSLLVEHAGQYPDFSNSGLFEYQLRARYRRPGETSMNDYWTGFISPVDGKENVTTFPFQVEFSATDGLGRLEDQTVSPPTTTNVNLFDRVLEALQQTGLDLDLHVDSGIRNASGDALIDVDTFSNALYKDKDRTKLMTHKELIEGLLSAFNCKIQQSNGSWYIFNASTHGGTGTYESRTWTTYEIVSGSTAYTLSTTPLTENLVMELNSSGSQDLSTQDGDLILNTRRPYGSVECKVKGVKERDLVLNKSFEPVQADGTPTFDGYNIPAASPDQFKYYLGLQPPITHPTANFAFRTTRNRFAPSTASAIWFETDPFEVDLTAPWKVSYDWIVVQAMQVDNVRMNWQIQITLDNPISMSELGTYNNGFNGASYVNAQYTTRNITVLYWDFGNNQWKDYGQFNDNKKHALNGQIRGEQVEKSERDVWFTASADLNPLSSLIDPANGNLLTSQTGTATIRWFYPNGKGTSGKDHAGSRASGRIQVGVTNLNLENTYESNITSPVFERVQPDYTTTLTYEPRFGDELPSGVSQRFIQNGFWKSGQTSSDTTTLERIVTQQKINDYRRQFRYYEGSLINLGDDPLSLKNKIKMNWDTYSEPRTLIGNGGTFYAKSNVFDYAMYLPNQTLPEIGSGDGDLTANPPITTGFFTQDINLVRSPFSGRSTKVTYWLAIVSNGLNDLGTALLNTDSQGRLPTDTGYVPTTNTLLPEIPTGALSVTGFPGQELSGNILLSAADGFEASASNIRWYGDGGAALPFFANLSIEHVPDYISDISFTDVGSDIQMNYKLTLPSQSEFEEIRIAGEVDPFVEGNVDFDLTFALDSAVTDAAINTTTRNLRGIPGTTSFVSVIVTPGTDKQLDASLFNVSAATGVVISSVEQMGTSVYIEIEITFQAADASETINVFGAAATDIPAGTDLSTVTLTLSESIGNVSLSRTSLTLTGIVGTTAVYDISTYAADGFVLNAGNFSAVESEPWMSVDNAIGGGETVLLPLEITFPAADASGTVAISGSAQADGADTVSIVVNFTNSVADSSLIDSSETFILNSGQRISYTNTLTPTKGSFMDASSLTITETVDTNNVVAFTASDAGGGSINISTSIVAPSTGSSVSADIELTGSVSAEPYVATVNITESLPFGRIINNTLSQRFGASDSNVVFTGVTVSPTTENKAYASGTTFTSTGCTLSAYTYAGGNVTFTVTASLPVFDASNPIGDVTVPISINTTVAPPGISGASLSVYTPQGGISATGGTTSIYVFCDGDWTTGGTGSITGGGNYAPQSGTGDGVINVDLPYLSDTTNARSIGIFVETLDGSSNTTVNLTQNDSFGRRIVFVTSLPTTQQPGILYITPV